MSPVQTKPVNFEEIQVLINESKKPGHPFYYRFTFSISNKEIIAKRIRKDSLFFNFERQQFYDIMVDTSHILAKSIDRIEKAKNKIGVFSYTR